MADADVEMKPKDDKSKTGTDATETKPAPPPATPVAEIKANIALIERAVSTLEPRFTHRVLRSLTALRRRTDAGVLREAIGAVYPTDHPTRTALLSWLPAPAPTDASMDIDADAVADADADTTTPPTTLDANADANADADADTTDTPTPPKPANSAAPELPEVEVYLRLLLLNLLLAAPRARAQVLALAHETVAQIQAWNRRSMDALAARVWFALGRAYELAGALADVRPLLLQAQRTAALRHDDESLAVLLNLLLRNYLAYHLYDQADKLVSKTAFPASAGNPQLARHHYYLGRIKAVQLDYSAAHTHLQQAVRRAPAARTAPGFFQAVHKFFVVVELLMGDIPERGLFRHPVLEGALAGYFDIVKAVRTGSLAQFQATLSAHRAQFTADATHTLIVRLRQNVIKTGVRRLSLSYARIALRDICVKLHLDSEEDAEYIVGKAIRDGVIEGRVVHAQGWMECAAGKGGYGPEAADVFGRRIGYCLELHNESVKAMRYPLNSHRKELAAAEGAREREKELEKELAEGDLDEDEGGLGEF